jgi:hypothetical protein
MDGPGKADVETGADAGAAAAGGWACLRWRMPELGFTIAAPAFCGDTVHTVSSSRLGRVFPCLTYTRLWGFPKVEDKATAFIGAGDSGSDCVCD